MSASSPSVRSAGLVLGSAVAVAAVLFAAFTAFSGSPGTSDSKPPARHAAPTAPGTAAASHAPGAAAAVSATPTTAPTCNLFDTECLQEHPGSAVSKDQEDDGGTGTRPGATPRVPNPPQGTAATGGGGDFGGSE